MTGPPSSWVSRCDRSIARSPSHCATGSPSRSSARGNRMSVVIAQIDIAAPPERVWEVAMDPRTTKEWVTIVRDVGPWDDGPLVKGFRMDQRLHLRGVTFKVE